MYSVYLLIHEQTVWNTTTNTSVVSWPLSWLAWPLHHMACLRIHTHLFQLDNQCRELGAVELIRRAWRCSCFMELWSVNILWRNVSMWWKVCQNVCECVFLCMQLACLYVVVQDIHFFTMSDTFIHKMPFGHILLTDCSKYHLFLIAHICAWIVNICLKN